MALIFIITCHSQSLLLNPGAEAVRPPSRKGNVSQGLAGTDDTPIPGADVCTRPRLRLWVCFPRDAALRGRTAPLVLTDVDAERHDPRPLSG
jgi:hypothetical protein